MLSHGSLVEPDSTESSTAQAARLSISGNGWVSGNSPRSIETRPDRQDVEHLKPSHKSRSQQSESSSMSQERASSVATESLTQRARSPFEFKSAIHLLRIERERAHTLG